MSFLDEAVVTLTSGKGGGGAATFHSEKYVPMGGPNGADGGRGGSIVLIADRGKRTLYDFTLHASYKADDGVTAVGNKRGKDAKDIVLRVPVGTIVHDTEDGEILADLSVDGLRYEVCRGGRGGMGNVHFTNSVRQAPKFAQRGAPGETVTARLELRLIADIGLIGLPNAGKSTLLSSISAARPKIGAYPFTTLSPNLGVVLAGGETLVVADLPGLIEGASEGIGLGHQFLRHAVRNKALLHVVDAFPIDESDPWANYRLIEAELKKYSQELFEKPRVIALNKSDIGSPADIAKLAKKFEKTGFPVYVISAATSQGLEPLKFELLKLAQVKTAEETAIPVLTPTFRAKSDGSWSVEKTPDGFVIHGSRIERLVAMADLNNFDGVMYMYRRLRRIGVIQELLDQGAVEGDSVHVGDEEFTFTEW